MDPFDTNPARPDDYFDTNLANVGQQPAGAAVGQPGLPQAGDLDRRQDIEGRGDGMGTYGPDAQHLFEEDESTRAAAGRISDNYGNLLSGGGLPDGKMYHMSGDDRDRVGALIIPNKKKVDMLQPTEQKMTRWIGVDLPDLLLPWVLFSFILICFGFAYRQAYVVAVLALVFCTALSLQLWLNSRGWPWRFLGIFSLLATYLGYIGGCHAYRHYLDAYYIYQGLPHYQNVLPASSPISYRDAGVIHFNAESMVEGARSVGYRNGDVYCAAPIVGKPIENHTALRGFWAVGTNCCGMRARFFCDDTFTSGVHGGMVMLPEMSDGSDFEAYHTAARMAASIYGLPLPEELRFVRWLRDVDAEMDTIWYGAERFVGTAILCFLACPCILALAMFLTKHGAVGNIRSDRAREWEWHATEAAQMDFGPRLNPAAWRFEYPLELRMDLAQDRAYWSGEVLHDYVFHLSNTSLFIGPIMCHPAHPFTRMERLFFLFVIVAFLWFSYAAMKVLCGEGPGLIVVAMVLSLLAIAIPRYLHKKFLRIKVRAEVEAALDGSGDVSPPRNALHLFFFAACIFITAASCILALVVMQDQGVDAGSSLADAWEILLIAALVDVLADAYGPVVVGALDDCHELRAKTYVGFFGRWDLERLSWFTDRNSFLWREDALHPRLRPGTTAARMPLKSSVVA